MADKFVDASVNSDSGTGDVGDPWTVTTGNNVIQKMLDNTTQGASGDTCHIKITGTAVDFSGTNLDFTTYTASNANQPLTISAYETAAWDVAGSDSLALIDLNGASTFVANTVDGLNLFNLDISGGTSWQLDADNHINVWYCKVAGSITMDAHCSVVGCEITNSVTSSACVTTRGMVLGNILTNVQNDPTISLNGSWGIAVYNLCLITTLSGSATSGIFCSSAAPFVFSNTVYSSVANTGDGITIPSGSTSGIVMNNYVEGFSGTGANGFSITIGLITRNNRWFNCTGNDFSGSRFNADNSELTESGLINAGSGNYRPTTDLIRAGLPSEFPGLVLPHINGIDIGAIQTARPNIHSISKRAM